MQVEILGATLKYDEQQGYVGQVQFAVKGHKQPYEMTLQSDEGSEWSYSLLFLNESGDENEIIAVEEEIDRNDELFERLVAAAQESLE
ncbi:hypothetical protein [Cohnella laeviribosi]|uniref:hypothetical protein n=1 Tax=Cohnella laeviribosi TaxID=380174 RepID=UPI00035CB9FC|nr:hypothetical protein [Cohnella laeviribosi]